MGEVSLQKSFPYSGQMFWEDNLKNLNGPQQIEGPQKQKGLEHCRKAHGAGHILLCGLVFFTYSENDRVIPIFCLVLGTMNNGSQLRIFGWEPSLVAPN